MKREWYRVVFEESFYDGMVGYVVKVFDMALTLKLLDDQVTFYKDPLRFEGEFQRYINNMNIGRTLNT